MNVDAHQQMDNENMAYMYSEKKDKIRKLAKKMGGIWGILGEIV